jgi:cell division protein FtsN
VNVATALTVNPQTVWLACPSAAGSGAQIPTQGQWYRWRIKSNNARRYATAAGASLAATGSITFTIRAVRY